jgi:hypothetical protein
MTFENGNSDDPRNIGNTAYRIRRTSEQLWEPEIYSVYKARAFEFLLHLTTHLNCFIHLRVQTL